MRESVKVEIVQKLPLLQSRWKSGQYYLYSFMKIMIHAGRNERSFESVSKDKFTRRRRAAFDTDEKDVRHERCKDTTSSPTSLNSSR